MSQSPESTKLPQPASFKDAKEARDSAKSRPGGGIFRRDGNHVIFENRTAEDKPDAASLRPGRETTQDVVMADATPPVASIRKGAVIQGRSEIEEITAPPFVDDGKKQTMTLFAFRRQWDKFKTPEDRWDLLNVCRSWYFISSSLDC